MGKNIAVLANSGRYLKKVSLELGGNSPFVVLDDADLEQAVKAAVFGKFLHQGQICMAINRIIVDKSVYKLFVEKFVAQVKKLKVGDPAHLETALGPIINQAQLTGLLKKIETAKAGRNLGFGRASEWANDVALYLHQCTSRYAAQH